MGSILSQALRPANGIVEAEFQINASPPMAAIVDSKRIIKAPDKKNTTTYNLHYINLSQIDGTKPYLQIVFVFLLLEELEIRRILIRPFGFHYQAEPSSILAFFTL